MNSWQKSLERLVRALGKDKSKVIHIYFTNNDVPEFLKMYERLKKESEEDRKTHPFYVKTNLSTYQRVIDSISC